MGYGALVSGTRFAEMGNNVTCIDIDSNNKDSMKKRFFPIYKPGLETMVQGNVDNNKLHFSTDLLLNIDGCDKAFIAVGTPMDENGSADLQYVLSVAAEIAQQQASNYYCEYT